MIINIYIYHIYIYIYDNKLDGFLERLNSFHPNLKFTSEHSQQEINFLDVTVQLSNNKFVTDL